MKVTNYKKSEEGISSFSVAATEQEIGVLVNIGLDAMVSIGLLSMQDLEQDGFADVDLSKIDNSQFYRA